MANQTVYGIVSNRAKSEKVIQALVDAGIPSRNISFLSGQGNEFTEFSSSHVESQRNWRSEDRLSDDAREAERTSERQGGLGTEKHTKAPEGATTGGITGGLIGGTLGLLAGIGALAIPGVGPFIAAGPLMATLGGIGVGAVTGGLVGSLIGLGIPEFEAKRYENRLKEGGILIAILVNDDHLAERAKDILERQGAEDVTISSESRMSKDYNNH